MSKEHELPSDSDEDDEDYVPDGVDEAVSEAESEGEAESGPEDENNENVQLSKKKRGKRGKSGKKLSNKRKKVETDDKDNDDEEERAEEKTLTEEEEKKKADSLWADFMSDTGTISRPKTQKAPSRSEENLPVVRPRAVEKVKITKIFEFAGEEVKVEKEVSTDSAEARLTLSTDGKSSSDSNKSVEKRVPRGRAGGLGGISSVLGQIGKKTKISTLEKSKLDWDTFKKQENLDEEINTHNRGKDGYLERQDFLQRADVRQFEIEKQLRTTARRSNR